MLKIAHHTAFCHPLPEGHRFPMAKYQMLPQQLLAQGLVGPQNFFTPSLADFETACLAHDPNYIRHLFDLTLDPKMVRRIGFPLSKELVDRERYILDGTIQAAQYAMQYGVAFNSAGGTHHAGFDFGEGFCLMNDQAVAAAWLLDQGKAERILIIDLDVHQGNGTAHIFENHPQITTFSMHSLSNFPFVKERSHLDVGLEDGMGDAEYLSILEDNLTHLFATIHPDFVFYQAGVDILETDKLGKLNMTPSGCEMRDKMVFAFCHDAQIPVQVSMGGGYSPQLHDIVHAYVATYRAAIAQYHLQAQRISQNSD